MPSETSKTNSIRSKEFFDAYLSGRVIDIGCGSDLVTPWAEPFDQIHGDAERILEFREAGGYDTVYSSHCLEHLANVTQALTQWWELVRPGGYLVLVVPDEDLYEQGIWPSLFNRDHKATFRANERESWSPVSFNLAGLLANLPDSQIESIERQDAGYDYDLKRHGLGPMGRVAYRLHRLRRNLFRAAGVRSDRIESLSNHVAFRFGAPIDQTLGPAVAQIQAVVKKQA